MQSLNSYVLLYTAKIEKTLSWCLLIRSLFVVVRLKDITELSVKVKGGHYVREVCMFKYAN